MGHGPIPGGADVLWPCIAEGLSICGRPSQKKKVELETWGWEESLLGLRTRAQPGATPRTDNPGEGGVVCSRESGRKEREREGTPALTLIGSSQGGFGWATQQHDSLDREARCWLHCAPGSCIGPWLSPAQPFRELLLPPRRGRTRK